MFRKNEKDKKELDVKKVNDVMSLLKNVLKITSVLLLIAGIYVVTKLAQEWKIKYFVFTFLGIVAPLFIGIAIAWLFDPFVKKLQKRGIKRIWGTTITYVLLLSGIALILAMLIPILSDQVNEFAKNLPGIFDTIQGWIDNFFDQLNTIEGFDAEATKIEIFKKIESFGNGLASDLPTMIVTFLKSFFSGMGTILVGLIIGFYLLVSFDGANDLLMSFIPSKAKKDTQDIVRTINGSLRKFVLGAVLDSTLVFIITSIGLSCIGLKGALLFGFFCGLTNVIPYAGPYIGGAPAVIVGFAQSPTIGILTILVIAVIQFLEGNFIQPLIMSKTTKLHPVTIMLGLLIFGHFWGILGMIVSTPIIASLKSILLYLNEKFELIELNT